MGTLVNPKHHQTAPIKHPEQLKRPNTKIKAIPQ